MADVTFDNVAKQYGDVSVIQNLNLHIDDGELMVLVGPSGCGKSTALRMIAGLEDVTSGTISIGGRAVNNLAPKDRDIAMVFQSYALYPHMTVRENLEFGLKMRNVARDETDRRVGVGRAIVRQPAVFLFDEPLSNLDAKLRVQTRGEITRLQQTLGTTSVYVTHDQIEAMTMGHRITVMRDGKIQQVGTPREVYEHPANAFVAQFIGTPPMNLIAATVENGAAFSIPVRLENGRKVILGIRPEHLTHGGAIKATVDVVEPIG